MRVNNQRVDKINTDRLKDYKNKQRLKQELDTNLGKATTKQLTTEEK